MRKRDPEELITSPGPSAGTGVAPQPASGAGASGEGAVIPAPPSALRVDWALFEHHLEDEDLTEQEKREFIEALWYIIVSFVDLGFGIEPVNQAMRAAALENPQPAQPVAETRRDSTVVPRP
ncbi:MAG: hypothetical protein M9905_06160 [Rhizobiaceae bacterium]|nr:hypothetical protein [Rhizobiaceae bacterium]